MLTLSLCSRCIWRKVENWRRKQQDGIYLSICKTFSTVSFALISFTWYLFIYSFSSLPILFSLIFLLCYWFISFIFFLFSNFLYLLHLVTYTHIQKKCFSINESEWLKRKKIETYPCWMGSLLCVRWKCPITWEPQTIRNNKNGKHCTIYFQKNYQRIWL